MYLYSTFLRFLRDVMHIKMDIMHIKLALLVAFWVVVGIV